MRTRQQPGRSRAMSQTQPPRSSWRRPDVLEWRRALSRRRDGTRRSPTRSVCNLVVGLLMLLLLASPASAALLSFQNCIDPRILASNPPQLQFVPLDVSATFDLQNPLHALNITIYGNVSGTANRSANYPPPTAPSWTNPNDTYGKIPLSNVENNLYTTLDTEIGVLSFAPYTARSAFCDSVTQGTCPLAPVFDANASNVSMLRAFSVQHDMLSTYRFATISSTLIVRAGDVAATELGCVSVSVTPDLGSALRNVLTYIPLLILILVGVATVAAAMYSPWGSTDPFRWTSNYGRDEDVLRLVTPGFADCLQYLQFALLTGALSLSYPGYYQPAISQIGWSALMFNQSFVGGGGAANLGRNPVADGVYAVNGTYGLDRISQLVGMASDDDIWPGMMVWLLVILIGLTLLIQLAFALRWVHREVAHIPEEDLRAKNLPFTVGNVIRIVFNYLLLPIVSLSFFQLVIARQSPAYSVALAALVVVIPIGFSLWLVRIIATTRPKSVLFDDLPTVLLYGPLYNTFGDDAAAFALVPIFLNFTRGVAIGALQPSGIAQLVLLAICEVVTILTLVAFRPFPSPTSMNIYHSCFALVRLLAIILSVTFVPSLEVSEGVRGWIGYVVLALHALVLIFGFFLSALQTLIEVIARLAGAGGNEGGATRGGLTKVLGMRQLSRRVPRRDIATRQSMGSEAAMLAHMDGRTSTQFDGSRPRSLSSNSAFLLNRAAASDGRASWAYESASAQGGGGGSHSRANSSGMYTPTTVGTGPFSVNTSYHGADSDSPNSGTLIGMHAHDPYYRPPRPSRPRRRTGDTQRSVDAGRGFLRHHNSHHHQHFRTAGEDDDEIGSVLPAGQGTLVPAYLPAPKDELEDDESQRPRTDYAVREVDFYYRVRGPPLSQTGTRKLKTGPADPTGPVSSATGWFRTMFRGKTKEKSKGFEVVRSARAPPPGLVPDDFNEPYRDDPEEQLAGVVGHHSRQASESSTPYQDRESDGEDIKAAGRTVGDTAETTTAPVLPRIDSGGSIELPSRVGSARSSNTTHVPVVTLSRPNVPRRSSRRLSSSISSTEGDFSRSQPPLTALAEASTLDLSHQVGGHDASSSSGAGPHSSLPLRTSTSLTDPGRLPFAANASTSSRSRNVSIASTSSLGSGGDPHHHQGDGDGFDETISSPAARVDRPSSMGYVAHHRASDSIQAGPHDPSSFTGSTAELVVDESPPRPT